MFDGSLVEVTPRPGPVGDGVAVELVWQRSEASSGLPRRDLADGANGFIQHPRMRDALWRATPILGPGQEVRLPAGTLPDGRVAELRLRRRGSDSP